MHKLNFARALARRGDGAGDGGRRRVRAAAGPHPRPDREGRRRRCSSLKTRDGATLNVKLADDVRVSALVKASLADIKKDSFIGIAGMPEADGSIKAFSIHMFLPAQRGVVPDRHGPWDARPNSTMTNAYVESIVTAKDGETLMVKYKDGEKKIIVTPETVIAAAAPGSKRRAQGRARRSSSSPRRSSRTVRCWPSDSMSGAASRRRCEAV